MSQESTHDLRNIGEHDGLTFEKAAEVLFDPFVRVVDASRHGEDREGAIGYSTRSRLLFEVHMVVEDENIRIIFQHGKLLHRSVKFMIPEKLKTRLTKDRAQVSVTLRMPKMWSTR